MSVVRARQWPLVLHAAVVGIGWFIVGMTLAVTASVNPDLVDSLSDLLPQTLFGAALVVAVVVAVPIAWPVWLAVGWLEAGLASRLGRGDMTALRTARRLLYFQAVAWSLLSVVCLVVGWKPPSPYADPVPVGLRAAFVGPLLAALWHLLTGRALVLRTGTTTTA